jgi:hypothetical protein
MTDDERAGYDRLTAEVEELRAEVAHLRSQQAAHVCVQPYVSVTPWQNNACAAPFAGQVYEVNIPHGEAISYTQAYGNTVCAGAAGVPQVLTFNAPAGQ